MKTFSFEYVHLGGSYQSDEALLRQSYKARSPESEVLNLHGGGMRRTFFMLLLSFSPLGRRGVTRRLIQPAHAEGVGS